VQVVVVAPSQLPPHAEPSLAQAARLPAGAPVFAAHVPTEPATSHASHWPLHAVLQHTPSTHWPLPHSAAAVHVPPKIFLKLPVMTWSVVTVTP